MSATESSNSFSGKRPCITQTEYKNSDNVSLETLSLLVGFPVDFIKKELVISGNSIPMKDLRDAMMTFLNNNFKNFEQ